MRTKSSRFLTLLLALLVQIVFAQEKTISGNVTDQDGLPLPGANIVVKGSTTGTQTDFDGNYTITASEGQTIVYSYIGQQTLERTVGESDVMNVQLLEDAQSLEEVVVSVVGIKRSEKSLGYATQTVSAEDISGAKESNLVNALSGKVSGIQVTNSTGAVGGSSRIILRGASSIFGNNQPLFIIDGVPVSNNNIGSSSEGGGFDTPNGAADINPDDIESINVLKGASAAALYGVRASNGVVVITTKRGRNNEKLGIDINSSITFENPLVLPDFQNSYGQGSDPNYFEYVNGTSGVGDGVDESWGPPLDVGLEFVQFESFINGNSGQPLPWVSNPDNVRNLYETGITTRNNISFYGGDDKTTFRLGLGYLDQKGMIPFTNFERFNVNGSGSRQLSDKINANFSVKYIKSNSDNLPNGGYDGSNPIQQTIWGGRQVNYELLRDWRNLPAALPGSGYGEGIVPINWNTQFQNNPYWQLENNRNTFEKNRIIGNFGLGFEITDNLTLTGNVGVDNYTTITTSRFAKGSAADAPTYYLYLGNRSTQDGYYDERIYTYLESNMDLLLTYAKEINEDFDVSLSVGGNRMHRKTTNDFRAVQLELPNLYNLSNIKSGTSLFNRNNHAQSAINSLYGAGELSFRNYLFLNVTGRNDWASVLPQEDNSFFYPSVSLSAVLTDILEIKSDIVDYLKIRGSWSKVGGFGPLAANDIIPTFSLSSLPWNGNTFGEYPTTLNNPNIKPESKTGKEAGLDARFFNNRVRLGATYYEELSEDLIIPVQVTGASGVRFVWDNVGEIRNRGVEIQLGATVLEDVENDFSVDLDFNFAKNDNRVLKAGKDDTVNDETLILGGQWNMNLEAKEGHPYGVIVGPSLLRNDAGEVVYENGLPQQGETKVLGNIQPDWTGGVNLTINYKNFSFGTLVDAKIGGDVYSMSYTWGRTAGVLIETLEGREGGIVGNGVMSDGNGGWVPNNVVVSAQQFNSNTYNADIAETSVFDASYVKLRQMSLGYSLPKKFISDIGMTDLSVSLVARNLAILYKKAPHIDPETGFSDDNGSQGQEFGQLASPRSIGIDINLKF